MWRPSEPAADDVSDLPRIDPQSKRRRSRRRACRDGLADQTVVQILEDVRGFRAFERALIGRVDLRSVIELALVHRLASLLWRLRRAGAIETGLFEIQGELLPAHRQDPSRGPNQPGTLQTATGANGHNKGPGSNGRAAGYLQAILDALQDPAVQLVGGPNLPNYEPEPPTWVESFWSTTPYGGRMCGFLSLLDLGGDANEIHPNYIWGLNFAIQRRALFELGGFHPDCIPDALRHFQGNGETGLTMVLAQGYKAVFKPGPQCSISYPQVA